MHLINQKVLITTGIVLCLVTTILSAGFEQLPGSYCSTRRDPCCIGRLDDCSVPVHDTRCYCDEFCNRTRSDDCCPDYWKVCLNIEPPQSLQRCYVGGRYYNYGDEVKINCNKCKCVGVDQSHGLSCEQNICLLDETLISSINSNRDLGWRAANYSEFWGRTLADGIKFRTGTLEPHKTVKRMQPVKKIHDTSSLPPSFDARTKWPGLIGESVDQGWCGASWAMSTVQVASDRFSVLSKGMEKVQLSAQQLLNCNDRGQQGCQGGHLTRAWKYIRKYGLVDEACYPWVGDHTSRCRLPRRTTLLSAGCTPLSNQRYRTELYKVGPVYRMKSERDVMSDIMSSGPVQATMMVHQDFFSYKSGIYRRAPTSTNSAFGYHSVRLIGWGEELDTFGRPAKYWLAVNTWGPYWGENGLFRIARSTNECNIEEFVLAAWSKTLQPVQAVERTVNKESNDII